MPDWGKTTFSTSGTAIQPGDYYAAGGLFTVAAQKLLSISWYSGADIGYKIRFGVFSGGDTSIPDYTAGGQPSLVYDSGEIINDGSGLQTHICTSNPEIPVGDLWLMVLNDNLNGGNFDIDRADTPPQGDYVNQVYQNGANLTTNPMDNGQVMNSSLNAGTSRAAGMFITYTDLVPILSETQTGQIDLNIGVKSTFVF